MGATITVRRLSSNSAGDTTTGYVARPIPALKSLAGGDTQVILAGTFSKLLFPDLRLAYVALPPQLVAPFIRAASLTSRHPQRPGAV